MSRSSNVILVDAETIEALAIEPRAVRDAVVEVLNDASAGQALGGLKAQVTAPTGTYFQALPAVSAKCGLACVKWAAVAPPSAERAAVSATILLSDIHSGATLAVLDAGWITRARTGALSAIAAQALAPPHSKSVGFIGAGAQARSQLVALRDVLPDLGNVSVFDRYTQSAEGFLQWVQQQGLQGRLVSEPAAAVREHDVVVSTVPSVGLAEPFLDAAWLADDCFVSMVDLGRSWKAQSLEHLNIVATDDVHQSEALAEQGKLAFRGGYAFTLADFAAGTRPIHRAGKNALIFGGIGLADLAAAALVWRHLKQVGRNEGASQADSGQRRT